MYYSLQDVTVTVMGVRDLFLTFTHVLEMTKLDFK